MPPHPRLTGPARPCIALLAWLMMDMTAACGESDTHASAGGSTAGTEAANVSGASTGGDKAGAPSSMAGSSPATSGSSAMGGDAGSSGAGAQSAGAGGTNVGGSGGSDSAQAGNSSSAEPSVTKDGEVVVSQSGVTIVSFGGYLNGESFQQDAIITFQGYQYAAWWNTARHVVLARRQLPTGDWSALEFTDYTNTEADAHNTISIGICAADGTIHLAFDHHVSTLHYRKSVPGVVTNPSAASWAAASFSAVSSQLVANTSVAQLTYPKFISEPGGSKLLFDARLGNSSSGDEYLWEYDGTSHAWRQLGRYIYGTGDSINAYPHGVSYGRNSKRLYVSWCWRETPDAQTNHDLLFIYSDDDGRTWQNSAGTAVATTGAKPVTKGTPGINVWPIEQNRGLINSEHMAVDDAGRVHVLLSHLPDAEADDANFDRSRTKSRYFHYLRDPGGVWTRHPLDQPALANFRGKLAITSTGNVYAILPDLRIAASSPASNYATWTLLTSDTGRFFSDPLIDTQRLLLENELSVFYPHKSSPNISVLDYSLQ